MKYRIIIFVFLGILILLTVLGFVFGRKDGAETVSRIEFWGLDDQSVWIPVISAYQEANPGVTVNYTQKPLAEYEKELLNSLASGSGPDVAVINNSWTEKHLSKLSPLPENMMSLESFKNIFADVAFQDLVRSERIYGLPFYVDTLALYFNKSLYNNSGIIAPPRTWDDFNSIVRELTSQDSSGNIVRSGAALGTAGNIKHAADILNLLMLQTGANMISKDGQQAVFDQAVQLGGRAYSPGESALNFYTGFALSSKPVYTWNARMPDSLNAFTSGRAAMYLGYARDLKTIRSSSLNFGVAPAPQIKDSKKDPSYLDVNFAFYQAGVVTRSSSNKNAAWNFLVFATSRNAGGAYLTASHLPPARRDLIEFTASDAALNVFAKQALTALSWPVPDDAEVKKIFERMITGVVLGQSTSAQALKEAAIEVTNLLR